MQPKSWSNHSWLSRFRTLLLPGRPAVLLDFCSCAGRCVNARAWLTCGSHTWAWCCWGGWLFSSLSEWISQLNTQTPWGWWAVRWTDGGKFKLLNKQSQTNTLFGDKYVGVKHTHSSTLTIPQWKSPSRLLETFRRFWHGALILP